MAIIKCSVTKSSWYEMYIEYTYTQSAENNQSTISHSLKLKQLTDSNDFNGTMNVTYYINGQSFSYNGNVDINDKGNTGYTITIKSGTTIVTHNNDGTKSISVSCSGSCNSGGYGPGNISLSSTNITLTTIPRASTISSAGNITLGNSCNIKWTPASSNFKYKVRFTIGTYNSGWSAQFISPSTTNEYTYTGFTIPLTVAEQLPSTVSGTMTVYLTTYNSNGTQIGSTASKTFNVTVPSTVIPTIGNVTVAIVNTNTTISNWNVAVAGYSKVNVAATASGSYGSTISSFTISGGYSTTQNGTSLNYTGEVIASSGSKTFTITAKDSRGRSSTSVVSSAITFYQYLEPSVTLFTVARNSSDSTKMVVKADWSFSSVNNHNSASAKLYYKKANVQSWTQYGSISKNTSITLSNFESTSSYNFRVEVNDSLSTTPVREEAFVSTISVLLDFRAGGKGLAIGKISESDAFEIALESKFLDDIYIDGEKFFDKTNSLIVDSFETEFTNKVNFEDDVSIEALYATSIEAGTPLAISYGGTGAATSESARANLGIKRGIASVTIPANSRYATGTIYDSDMTSNSVITLTPEHNSNADLSAHIRTKNQGSCDFTVNVDTAPTGNLTISVNWTLIN